MTTHSSRPNRADLLEAALDASSQALWEWNLVTGKLGSTHGLGSLLGYQESEPDFTGENWLDLVHPHDRAAAERLLQEHIAGRSSRFEVELRLRKSNGEFVHVLSRGRVTGRDESGTPVRLVGAHFDISGRANLEQRLSQARKMEAVGLFAAGIAHDFNNLLTVIIGYSDLLSRSLLPDQSRAFLEPIHSAGAIAASLVRRLLAFSRRRAQEPSRIDLNGVVRELGGMFQRILPENIHMVSHLDTSLGAVLADPGSLEQVLMNLVLNARDAMPEGGALEIATANLILTTARSPRHPHMPPGDYVLLTVSDTGMGMDQTTRERVFEPFQTTKPAGIGTGLGLSTVYGVVKQIGGWIFVRSEKGAGTTFRVYLPRVEAEAPPQPAPLPAAPEHGNESILVIEDNPEVRTFMRAALRNLGYSVAEAAGAREASEVLRNLSRPIDLLIIDAVLPDAAGQEIARQFAAVLPELAVLYVSGYGEPVTGPAEKPAEFLAKPFTWQMLGVKVHEVLRKRKPRRVLVVEDDPKVARFIEQVLRADGLEVLLAENGKSAMAIAEAGAVHLVIADLFMPEREGIETIIALRNSKPALPVIAMSGDPAGHLLKMAVALGARDSIQKPFSAAALLDLVHKTLRTA